MKVAFRADASIEIGTGHVMRCLTLAEALMDESVDVTFMCRPHEGNLIPKLINKGIKVIELSPPNRETDDLVHSHWLGATQQQDAEQCIERLESKPYDWLIVDHYGIDERWHKHMRDSAKSIMVIDDLADRKHDCDLLLDQNLGSTEAKYRPLVPEHCSVLAGPEYALLRPEFLAWREYSLQRRQNSEPKTLLVNLGGVDQNNVTSRILAQLNEVDLPWLKQVKVVMGASSPHIGDVSHLASVSHHNIKVLVDAKNMAELMANSDFAIGAAGSTSWERCCLGLPTLMLAIADNQRLVAQQLENLAIVRVANLEIDIKNELMNLYHQLSALSVNSSKFVDGKGCSRVQAMLTQGTFSKNGLKLIPYAALNSNEVDCVLRMRNHDSVRAWMNCSRIISQEQHSLFISGLARHKDACYFFVKKFNEILGCFNFKKIDFLNSSAEFGVFANPFLLKKGKGTMLTDVAMKYAIGILKMRRIELIVHSENKVAIALYLKFGFNKTDAEPDCGIIKMEKIIG